MSEATRETSADILREMRLGVTGDMPFAYMVGMRDVSKHGMRCIEIKKVTVDELADRIEAAVRRDERLMLRLMLYAVDDYVEEWATKPYLNAVKAACRRLGIEYGQNAAVLQAQIERRLRNEKR